MSIHYLCTTDVVPPGFVQRTPEKRDILRGTLVLFTPTREAGEAILGPYRHRVRGLLVAPGDQVGSARIDEMLWFVSVTEAMTPHLYGLVTVFVETVRLTHESHEQNVVLSREVERLRDVLSATRAHYNLATERLQSKVERLERMEQALREKEADLAITLDSIGDAVVATDAAGAVRRMNPVAEELSAWRREDAQGRALQEVFELLDPRSRERLPELVARVRSEGKVMGPPGYALLVGRDGRERLVSHSGAPIRAASGKISGVVAVFRDVSEQSRLEEQVRQGQRMDALGQLAGGVAHDFNNILSGMVGYSDLLRRRVAKDPISLRYVEALGSAAERAAGLTRQLLVFARSTAVEMRAIDIHGVIQDAVGLARSTFDRRIEICAECQAEQPSVVAEASLVHTVLLNLLINARDAIRAGGSIRVRTANTMLDAPQRSLVGAEIPAGRHVVVEVSDSGEGIAAVHLPRIFEPFFTTKGPDRGTGLGLAAVYGIMRDHHGAITVSSELGRGTTFRLYFPVASALASDIRESPLRNGQGHVLVVDDDSLVRAAAVEGLIELGYRVSEATNGREAVNLVEAQRSNIDVVLLDLNMPVMHGRDALAAIRRLAPELPVLIISGFLAEAQVQDLMAAGANGVLQKPCRLADLSRHVGQALKHRSGVAHATA